MRRPRAVRTGGEAAAAAAAELENERDSEKLLAVPGIAESSRGLPGATAGRSRGESALEKGKAAAVEGELQVESSPRQNFRHAVSPKGMKKVAAHKGKKKLMLDLLEGENILTEAGVANILLGRNGAGGEPFHSPIIHKASVYAKPPSELVQEVGGCTVWSNKLGVRDNIWLFRDSAASDGHGHGKRRCRMVGGSGRQDNGKWHGEGRRKPVQNVLRASRKQYSYTINSNNINTTGDRTGWCMAEFSLTDQKQGTDQICAVYQSNRSYPETPTTETSFPDAETPSTIEQGSSVDPPLDSPGTGSGMLSQSIGFESTTDLLVQAFEKATSYDVDWQEAFKINEFVRAEQGFLRTIYELGLDSSIISKSLHKLKVLLENAAITKELTSKARDVIVSCGEHMSTIIHSAFCEERKKRAQQENNALRRIGVNIHDQVSNSPISQVMDVSSVTRDSAGKKYERALNSAKNERQIQVNSFAVASSSGVKRKAVDDHPEAPPSAREEWADTEPIGPEETDRTPFSQNDPIPVGYSNGGALGASSFEVQPELHGLAEVREGGSGPGNALDELERNLLSEDDPMEDEGDNGGYPDGLWAGILQGKYNTAVVLPVGGGVPALAESVPGVVNEVDAGQGSWMGPDGPEETEHPSSPNNDLTAVRDAGEFIITEAFPGEFDVEEYTQKPIDIGSDWYLVSPSEAESEITFHEMTGGLSADQLLGASDGVE